MNERPFKQKQKGNPCRILHLDDDPRDQELVGESLGHAGWNFELTSVSCRKDFESALAREKFALILSDYQLPELDGMQALAIARAVDPEIPFILVSGALGEERVAECLRGGITDYVLKHHLDRLVPAVMRAVVEAEELYKRRQAEVALHSSNERLREQAEMLNQARDSIILTDLEDRITYWNRGSEQLYGWPATEAIGKKIGELFAQDSVGRFNEIREVALVLGAWSGETRCRNRYGQELLIEASRTLIRDAAGKPKGFIAISSDITERKKLEAQVLRAQRMESIGTLAGGIAHDLNNVFGPILLSLGLLSRKQADPGDQELIGQIQTAAQRGASIVRQILTFARGLEGERAALHLGHLIAETQLMLRETFPKGIRLNFNKGQDTWLVKGDATQLQQVLMNLCVNARDAMGETGRLTVEAENVVVNEHDAVLHGALQPGPHVVLRVSDTGCGIPEDQREKIFDPFFTTKEVGHGTGLGLSTTLNIVKTHGGFLQVESEVGKGTTFQVYLPAEGVSAEQVQQMQRDELVEGQGETILVVDDEAGVLTAVKTSLERHGYRVLTASDGAECLGIYVQHREQIALVLTDMMMPVVDGATTARALMTINPAVKIIVSSGLATEGAVGKAVQAGVKHFLNKPYSLEGMLKILRQVINEAASPPTPNGLHGTADVSQSLRSQHPTSNIQ